MFLSMNSIREPLNHTLMNSQVISDPESGNCFSTSSRSLLLWVFKILLSGMQMLQESLEWDILIRCLFFPLSHLNRMLPQFPNLNFLLCFRPGMLFFEKHYLFKTNTGAELVAISSSRGYSWPRDQTCISWISSIDRQILCRERCGKLLIIN